MQRQVMDNASAEARGGFLSFAAISGTGWLIDMGLTMASVQLGLSPFFGSAIGAATAVTFVYVVSRLFVMGDRQIGGATDFALYVVWQVVAIAAASALVAALAHLLAPLVAAIGTLDALAVASGLAKVLVTPLTLIANFLFLRWLTTRGSAARRGEAS